MSYKHFNDIQNLYEAVSENDNIDKELTEELITVISTSMFVEGYSTTAINGYFQQSTSDEIVEKYYQCSENISFVDEKIINEDVDHDLVLDEESLDALNETILQQVILQEKAGVKTAIKFLRKTAAPTARELGRKFRQNIDYKGALKTLKSKSKDAIKVAKDKASGIVKSVSKKGNAVKGLPPGIKGAKLGPKIKTGSEIFNQNKIKGAFKGVESKTKKVVDALKTPGKTTKNLTGKVANFVKKKLPFIGAIGVGGAVGYNMEKNKKSETKSTPTPETKSTPTPDNKKSETDTKKTPDFSSIGDSIKASQTDAGKEIIKSVTTPKEKPAPSKPSTASGKETPKPRAIGKGKGEINPNSARGRMIAKNQERFGKDRIQKLRDKNAAFQAARKKGSGYSMDDFVKDFPDSNTAKDRAKRKKTPSVMDYESFDPSYDSKTANKLAEIYNNMYNTPSGESGKENLDESKRYIAKKVVGTVINKALKNPKNINAVRAAGLTAAGTAAYAPIVGTAVAPETTQKVMKGVVDRVKEFSKPQLDVNRGGKKKEEKKDDNKMEAYDLVLEYLLSTEQADTIEEANYIMTEMDAQTIQGIVEDFEKQFQ